MRAKYKSYLLTKQREKTVSKYKMIFPQENIYERKLQSWNNLFLDKVTKSYKHKLTQSFVRFCAVPAYFLVIFVVLLCVFKSVHLNYESPNIDIIVPDTPFLFNYSIKTSQVLAMSISLYIFYSYQKLRPY